jgi:hypothetical protein
MAVVKGYADDSRPNNRIWAVGGYVGNELQWQFFEYQWQIILAQHDVPYFHMREMADPRGVYGKWHPPEDHYEERAAFFADLSRVINNCWLRPFFSLTRVNDLDRFNKENGLNLEPYPLAAFGCMISVATRFLEKQDTCEIIFDHVEKIHSKLVKAAEFAENDKYYPQVAEKVITVPLNKKTTFREVLPLQAADFLIWEIQKYHLGGEEWFSLPNKPTAYDQRWLHREKWSLEKYGAKVPPARKSLAALASGASPSGMIWDYDILNHVHQLRRGRWPA